MRAKYRIKELEIQTGEGTGFEEYGKRVVRLKR